MPQFGLRDRILLYTLLPTLTIGLILGGYFTLSRYHELNDFLTEQGNTIIAPLATATQNALNNGNATILNELISESHNKHTPLIKSIAVFNKDHDVIVTSNYHPQMAQLSQQNETIIAPFVITRDFDDSLVFSAPLFKGISNQKTSLILSKNRPIFGYISIQLSKERANNAQKNALLISTLVIILAFVVALLLGLKLSRHLHEPLKKLILASDKLGQGTLETELDQPMVDEFELLRDALNTIAKHMVIQKDEMQSSIDQATSDYRKSIELYETQNIQLSFAKREAQQANQVKSDFLAKMSHELRTPLNGVIGFTRQLYKTPLNKHQKDYLDTIELSANSLLTIISDILDFSKLEAGAMELEKIHFQLRDTVNEVLTLLAPSAHEKKLELSVNISPNVIDDLIGDPTRLKQILINLISNAIKFTDNGSVTIDITGRRGSNNKLSLLVSVKDTGIGIDSSKQDSLFMAFGQADSSITRKFGGTGLGLIITKHLVEAMGGQISLNSASEKGSCFTFNALFELPQHHYSSDLPTKPLQQKRILYFEQHEHSYEATLALLTSWQLQVTGCNSIGDFEKACMGEFGFDLCIVGQDLDPDSIKDVKTVMSLAREKCDYLYVLVNTVSHNLKETVINAGADACLSKPINHRKLCETMAAPYRLDHPSISTPDQKQQRLPLKALVVDDNDANLKLMCALLDEQLESYDTAHNGAQAVSLAKTHKYDLIFLDIQMPIMDGVTACKLIIDSSLNEQTPIIAVTAHALATEKEQLLKTGFTGYLTKPIDEEILTQAIFAYGLSTDKRPKKVEAVVSESKAPFESHCIDWILALQRAGGKEELAEEMLSMLIVSVPETQKLIAGAISKNDHEKLLEVIHKFHGACCYTGVPRLKRLAETIETSLKKNVPITQIEPELFELQDELTQLMHDAGAHYSAPNTIEE